MTCAEDFMAFDEETRTAYLNRLIGLEVLASVSSLEDLLSSVRVCSGSGGGSSGPDGADGGDSGASDSCDGGLAPGTRFRIDGLSVPNANTTVHLLLSAADDVVGGGSGSGSVGGGVGVASAGGGVSVGDNAVRRPATDYVVDSAISPTGMVVDGGGGGRRGEPDERGSTESGGGGPNESHDSDFPLSPRTLAFVDEFDG